MAMTKQEVGRQVAARRRRGERGRFAPGAIGGLHGFSQVRKTGGPAHPMSTSGPAPRPAAPAPVHSAPRPSAPPPSRPSSFGVTPEAAKQAAIKRAGPHHIGGGSMAKEKEDLYWKQAAPRIAHHARMKSFFGKPTLFRQHDTGLTRDLFRSAHNNAVGQGHAPGSEGYHKALTSHYESFGHMGVKDYLKEKASRAVGGLKAKVGSFRERILFGKPHNGETSHRLSQIHAHEAKQKERDERSQKSAARRAFRG